MDKWVKVVILMLVTSWSGLSREAEESAPQALPSHSNLVPPAPADKPSALSQMKGEKEGSVSGGDSSCSSGLSCEKLGNQCVECNFSDSCIYGQETDVSCWPKNESRCTGEKIHERSFVCRYCYQTQEWEHICTGMAGCNARAAPQQTYRANCTVKNQVLCMGNRSFFKNLRCRWTAGASWSTALALSVTLGGFGADRFYLGHWQEGIGKLFSFGGLGVWTLVDVVLVATRYLGPADGSLYAS